MTYSVYCIVANVILDKLFDSSVSLCVIMYMKGMLIITSWVVRQLDQMTHVKHGRMPDTQKGPAACCFSPVP